MSSLLINDGTPCCPHCGENLVVADNPLRIYKSISYDPDTNTIVAYSSTSEMLWGTEDDPYLFCRECGNQIDTPEGVDIDFD